MEQLPEPLVVAEDIRYRLNTIIIKGINKFDTDLEVIIEIRKKYLISELKTIIAEKMNSIFEKQVQIGQIVLVDLTKGKQLNKIFKDSESIRIETKA